MTLLTVGYLNSKVLVCASQLILDFMFVQYLLISISIYYKLIPSNVFPFVASKLALSLDWLMNT